MLVAAVSCAGDGGTADEREGSPAATAPTTGPSVEDGPDDEPTGAPRSASAERLCRDATEDAASSLEPSGLVEVSGVVVSRRHDDVLWVHEDSGAPPVLTAIGADGRERARVVVTDAEAVDWEDLAVVPGPDGTDHLVVADLGDNTDVPLRTDRPIRLYRVPEPDPGAAGSDVVERMSEPATAIDVAYDDGPRDAETLLADPLTGDLVIVSKQWDGTAAGVYVVPADLATAPDPPAGPVVLAREADVAGSEGTFLTGGDVSADGSLVVLRTYLEVWLWDRDPSRSVPETLAGPPTCRRTVLEPQGEAVAVAPDGRSFVTISEGEHPPVRWFHLDAPAAGG